MYHGSRTGVREKASQVIYSEEFPGNPTTFGFSLSGALDMDLNEYPDLAIGAYESDVAIFLRLKFVNIFIFANMLTNFFAISIIFYAYKKTK